MVSVDGSLIIQIVNFILLIWILNNVMYKPIRNILQQRHEKMVHLEQGINTFRKGAGEKEEALEMAIRTARQKGMDEKKASIAQAAEMEKEIVRRINEKAQTEMAEVRARLEKEALTVRHALQKEIDSFAAAIGEKILGRAL